MITSLNLSDLLFQLFGVNTTEFVNRVVSQVGATVTKIMNYDYNRVSFVITNNSANSIYVLPFNTVSSSKGLYLAASGGIISMQWDRDFNLVGHEWYAIAAGAGSNVTILENVSIGRKT